MIVHKYFKIYYYLSYIVNMIIKKLAKVIIQQIVYLHRVFSANIFF